MVLLSVEHLSKAYKKGILILDNVGLSVEEGEVVGLIGESGSGKSTLAKVIMQLESSQSGQIRFKNKAIEKAGLSEFYTDCQIVFQNASAALNPSWTVQKILYESLPSNKKRADVVKRMLAKVKLNENLLTSRPAELSGGEKQRVNLLRAILVEPELLICDEVVSGLDRLVQKEIIDLLIEINHEMNMAILFISHDLQIINYFCERTYVIKNGKIVDQAKKINDRFDFKDSYAKKLITAAEKN
jgi:ABC-type dipeptide/oligopeptide/nickel transport system ATPase subunit